MYMTKHSGKHLTLQLDDKMLFDLDFLRQSYSRRTYLQKLIADEIQLQVKLAEKRGLISSNG